MLTMPTTFQVERRKNGAKIQTVVAIQSPVGDLSFYSTSPFHLDWATYDFQVSGRLIDHTGISHTVDIFHGEGSYPNVTLRMDNGMDQSGQRLSDIFTGMVGSAVLIYLLAGAKSNLTNMMKIFEGIIGEAPSYDNDNMFIRVVAPHRNYLLNPVPDNVLTNINFGSWIDNAAHSNSYTEGDDINRPAYYVEYLLIDKIGVPEADIDMSSFDAAVVDDLTCRDTIHFDSGVRYIELIKQFMRQGMFTLVITPTGTYRLVSLGNKAPSTDRMIFWDDLIGWPTVSESSHDYIRNKLLINHTYVDASTHSTKTIENNSSQTTYGFRERETNFWALDSTSIDWIAERLVGDSDGFWSNPHTTVTFEIRGFRASDIEVGDYIEFDSLSFDVHLKIGGESWEKIRFLIIHKQQMMYACNFVALRLYTGYIMLPNPARAFAMTTGGSLFTTVTPSPALAYVSLPSTFHVYPITGSTARSDGDVVDRANNISPLAATSLSDVIDATNHQPITARADGSVLNPSVQIT